MYGGTTREDPEYLGILSIPDTVSVRGYSVWNTMCGGTTREDPKYPGILSIPYSGHCVCEGVCMGGQLGRIPSIPGYLVFRTLCRSGILCMGGQLGRIPSIPGS